MKKLLLSLLLINLTAQAMKVVDEEAATPTEQIEKHEKTEEMQVEKQEKLNERVKRVSCCRKLGTRLKKSCYEITVIGSLVIAGGFLIYNIWA